MNDIIDIFLSSAILTSFVFTMMLIIEYFNILTKGNWDKIISQSKKGQIIFTTFLGITPGCLGAYATVSLYLHKVITMGALLATMIATSGDEAFLMLAMFPKKALFLFAILFFVGIFSGWLLDKIIKPRIDNHTDTINIIHADSDNCISFSSKQLIRQWRECSPQRAILSVLLAVFTIAVISGHTEHHHFNEEPSQDCSLHQNNSNDKEQVCHHNEHHEEWNWVRLTLLAVGVIGLLIVITVPNHFLEKHLWEHIAKVHIWKIFLWTFGALLVIHFLTLNMNIKEYVSGNQYKILAIACLIGLIPTSGPHLIFVTLFARGEIPFSILLASSIVQDGHGMLPLLAHSRKDFFYIKAINFVIGLTLGIILISLHF